MGHWYSSSDGSPQHTYTNAKGVVCDTTLRQARKEGYVPSVTEILNVAAKPGLEKWKLNQLKLAMATLPKIEGESIDEFVKRAEEDAKQHAENARGLGVNIHSVLEDFYKTDTFPTDPYMIQIVSAVEIELLNKFGEQDWIAEKTFASPLGYGGTVDLHCDSILIDFKSREFSKDDKVMGWPEQGMQLSAYKHGLGLPSCEIWNCFISTSEPGLVRLYQHDDKDYFERFKCLLNYWCMTKDYYPQQLWEEGKP
jgi:hypothetical protein